MTDPDDIESAFAELDDEPDQPAYPVVESAEPAPKLEAFKPLPGKAAKSPKHVYPRTEQEIAVAMAGQRVYQRQIAVLAERYRTVASIGHGDPPGQKGTR